MSIRLRPQLGWIFLFAAFFIRRLERFSRTILAFESADVKVKHRSDGIFTVW